MLSDAENARLTRIGPDTPAGRFMRSYWQPILTVDELPECDGAPVRVRILGEDLIAFRDSDGAVGLIDAYCPHRRAPLFFGRNEECGLRCVYHGWKFDRTGACVDMPSEPPDSLFKSKVRVKAYSTWEGAGLVWACLSDTPPPVPDYAFVRVPATHRNVVKIFQDNNWLQGLEGAIDSVHSGFLHNDDLREKSQLRNATARVEFEQTKAGLSGAAIHALGEGRSYFRAFGYIMPAHSLRVRTLGRTGTPEEIPTISGQIWVPIDDHSSWLFNYMLATRPDRPLTPGFVDQRNTGYGRGPEDFASGHRLKRTRENDYLIDRELQRTRSFSGIKGMNTQDIALQECMGPILDRSREHLAHSDRVIIALRRCLLDAVGAVERGDRPGATDPADYADVQLTDVIADETLNWTELV